MERRGGRYERDDVICGKSGINKKQE